MGFRIYIENSGNNRMCQNCYKKIKQWKQCVKIVGVQRGIKYSGSLCPKCMLLLVEQLDMIKILEENL